MWLSDEEYVFQQDIREKKAAGRGAFHKKCGSKSKKCTLPSDYLTRKEKAKLNSECKSWSMKKFYSWEEFKQMPDDIRLQYVHSLINRYNIGLATIAENVFHVSNAALRKNFEKSNLLEFVNKSSKGSGVVKGTKQLLVDMGLAVEEAADDISEPKIEMPTIEVVESEPIVEAPSVEVAEPVIVEKKTLSDIRHVAIDLNGFDDDLWDFFKGCFKYQAVSIHMSIQVKES